MRKRFSSAKSFLLSLMARQVMNQKTKQKIHSLSFGNNYISDQFSKKQSKASHSLRLHCNYLYDSGGINTSQIMHSKVLSNLLYGFYIRYPWLQKYHLVKKLPIIRTILKQKYPSITFADLTFDGFMNKVVDLLWVELNRTKSLTRHFAWKFDNYQLP